MSVSDVFKAFLDNLKVDKAEQISLRYGEITHSLNKKFRDTESKVANTIQVGSYGRYTGIKGISDLDMIYIMPKIQWDNYKDGKQSQLLADVKDAIKARYPKTEVRVDRLVVTVTYSNFHVEVQPAFEEVDATPIEGFDPAAVDKILGLREKGLRSAVLLPLGYRNESEDWLVNLVKVRKPMKDLVTVIE